MMTGDFQTPEELGALCGPGSAFEAARAWLTAVIVDEDLAAAWTLTDPALRFCLAQAWLWEHRDEPTLAHASLELVAQALQRGGAGLWWESFAADQVAACRESWGIVSLDSWGFLSRPRPIAPDLELLLLANHAETGILITEPTMVSVLPFLMRHTASGWLVASFAEQLPQPGWPPSVGS
jgi:hypothetical protein